jgi:hypothetical protein
MLPRVDLANTFERLGRYYETVKNLRAARQSYANALGIWRDWAKYGVSGPYNLRREQEAARMLASCDARLCEK